MSQALALPSTGKLLRWAWNSLDLVEDAGDLAANLAEADSMVERWEAIKPFGDKLAPAVDELLAEDGSFSVRADVSISDDDPDSEVEAKILAALRSRPRGLAAGGRQRDGKWLNAGLEIIKVLLPILLKRAMG